MVNVHSTIYMVLLTLYQAQASLEQSLPKVLDLL